MAIAEFNHWQQIADALTPALAQIIKKTALDLQAQAASRAPVDTGFLRNSIYASTADGSGYHGGSNMLPEVPRPTSTTEAYVAVGANYGVYVEYGTRFMPAKPYFNPAVAAVQPGFDAALDAIETKLAEAAG